MVAGKELWKRKGKGREKGGERGNREDVGLEYDRVTSR